MGRHVRLFQRGGRWTFRVFVPEDIRPIVGKSEIWKSLGAVSHKEAVRLSHIESVKVDGLFAAARQQQANDMSNGTVSDVDLERLARAFLHKLEVDSAPMPFSEAARAERRDAAEEQAALVVQSVEDAGLQRVAIEAARESGLMPAIEGAAILRAAEAIQRAVLEHLAREADRAELKPERVFDPLFEGISRSGPAPAGKVKVTFKAIVEAQETKRSAGEGAKAMPEKSVKKYKRIADAFTKFRGSDDATTVKASEVEDWRDAMLAAGQPSNRTIADRLVSLGTIIQWGKTQKGHREAMKAAEKLAGTVEAPSYIEKPADTTSYSMEEARTLLAATKRLVASPGKVHNRDSKRWLPWICVYGGLRISEAEQLQKADFFEVEGSWFYRVTTTGRRSLKTRSSQRVIPLHPAIEAEGFIDWLEAAAEGQLFASSASSYMGRWVRSDEVGITRVGISPNHGLRHLLKGLCLRYAVGDEPREYLLGHASADVHRKYGATDVMLPGLAVEMRKIVPLSVPSFGATGCSADSKKEDDPSGSPSMR